MDVSKRKWNHALGAWLLDTEPEVKREQKLVGVVESQKASNLFWDSDSGTWMDEADFYKAYGDTDSPEPPEEKKEFTAAACEVPPEKWQKERGEKKKSFYSGSYNNYSNWKPCYPWEGVDRAKFPKTWWTLFFQYHQMDWHRGTYINEELWKKRLAGEYLPLPKYGHQTSYHGSHYGPYNHD